MSTDGIAITGFIVLFALMLLRVPIGMAMGLVGVSGFAYLSGGGPALKIVGHTTMRTVTDFNFAVIPLFLLMVFIDELQCFQLRAKDFNLAVSIPDLFVNHLQKTGLFRQGILDGQKRCCLLVLAVRSHLLLHPVPHELR